MAVDKSRARIRRMFGEIAGRYDLLNHLLSCQIDRYWRWKAVRIVPPAGNARILDVCTGTGDLAISYFRASRGTATVIAADFCHEMLVLGGRKLQKIGAEGRVALLEADTERLPFVDNHFHVVCVAFGLRNVADTDRGLQEMVRVCIPGGRVAVLEFSTPAWPPLRAIYGWYLQRILPRIGQLLSGSRENAYNYLPASVGEFPCGDALAERMAAAGLDHVAVHPLTLGIASIYVGTKVPRKACCKNGPVR